MLNSLPITDSSAGMVIDAREGSVADALAGAVGRLDRLQDVLERRGTIDGVAPTPDRGRTWP